jgi:hypothetical protein
MAVRCLDPVNRNMITTAIRPAFLYEESRLIPSSPSPRRSRNEVMRAFLAILLLAAAGAYFGFATLAGVGLIWLLVELGGHCFRRSNLARVAWLSVVACRRMGIASPLGRSSSLLGARKNLCCSNPCDRMYQLRRGGCRLHRPRPWPWATRGRKPAPRYRSFLESRSAAPTSHDDSLQGSRPESDTPIRVGPGLCG